jgi:serine/threonine-protein kinase HipA
MNDLSVFLCNRFVGKLWTDEKQRFVFQYDRKYLESPDAMALSYSLPLTEAAYENDASRPFFSNLLPEGEVRSIISKIKQISEKNDFKLLEAIGGECAGAVSILPPGKSRHDSRDYTPLSDEEMEELLEKNIVRPILVVRDELRLSLAGAQNKIPIYINDNRFFLTSGDSPSTHILKPQAVHFKDTVQNELFCQMIAEETGLTVPKSCLWEGKKHVAFVTERYDRIRDDQGKVTRLHQEDFCQALGYMPEQKYEAEGGPGLAECFRLVKDHSSQPLPDSQSLYRWIVFNYLIGNADAHAKNLSFIIEGSGKIKLAPFYDLISTLIYPEISKKMAMKIGKESRFEWVYDRHWQRMADQADIKFSYLKGILLDYSNKLPGIANELADDFIRSNGAESSIRQMCNVISKNAKHIRDSL